MVAVPAVPVTGTADPAEAGRAVRRLLQPPGPVDPYPDYELLRRNAPVFQTPFGLCFVSGYAPTRDLLGHPDFAVQDVSWFDTRTPGWRDNAATRILYQGVQSRNPPDHGRLRRVLGGAFGPRRMAQLAHSVGVLTDGCLDAMAERGGPVDLVEALALPVPVGVIGELLGVPPADRQRFSGLARPVFGMMDLFVGDEERRRADAAATELCDYWTAVIADRRRRPRPDLAGELVAARDAGQLDDEELLATLVFLFVAGFGTTAALLGNAALALLQHPDVARRLRADESLVTAVVEESLRHETPTQLDPRVAVRDTVLGGVAVPAGQFVIALLGAANRDPARFPDPDRYDVDRPDNRVLSFGGGMHYCLGAPLSRMEASVILPRLFRRFPELRLAGEPVREPALRMRNLARLPVTW